VGARGVERARRQAALAAGDHRADQVLALEHQIGEHRQDVDPGENQNQIEVVLVQRGQA